MTKLVIRVENVNDKLIQRNWVNYMEAIEECLSEFAIKVFFCGHSRVTDNVQSLVWIIEYNKVQQDRLVLMLREIEGMNKMKDSINLDSVSGSWLL